MFRRRPPDTEAVYRQGVARWQERELEGAVALLDAALAHRRADDDNWWFAASRARAQIAMELDDADTAAVHLAEQPGHPVGVAQQNALRGRLHVMRDEAEAARVAVSMAVQALGRDREEDVGSLMNGAIALMWSAQVLVELGYGGEVSRLSAMAHDRIERAGIHDPALEAGLGMVEAAAARLKGDPAGAADLLASVDASVSPDVPIEIEVETARLAWGRGGHTAARALYEHAAEACRPLRYRALERMIRAEAASGPVEGKTDPAPLEEWAGRILGQAAGDQQPYSVVVRLVMDRPLDDYFDVAEQVKGLLTARPDLGIVDGTGTDGHIWELFLDGENPDALWEVVAPAMTALASPGSRVELRRPDGTQTIPLP